MKFVINGRLPGLNEAINAARTDGRLENRMRKENEQTIQWCARAGLKKWKPELPVMIRYTFYEKDKRRDKDNVAGYAVKLIQDALVRAGYLPNDNWAAIAGYTLDWRIDKKKPRIEVEIESAVQTNIFDQEERIYPCTVQILRNSETGEVSWGWWEGEEPPKVEVKDNG